MIGKEFHHISEKKTKRHERLFLLGFFSVVWGGLLTWRLLSLQVFSFEQWEGWASKQHASEVEVSSERGPILDRHGRLLAVSVPSGSIYVRPKLVRDKERVIALLSTALDIEPMQIKTRLDSTKPFVWVKRQIPREIAEEIDSLKLPGVGFLLEARRYYPYNHAAAALLGKVGVDGAGLSGLEAVYEKRLHTEHAKVKVNRDAVGNFIQEINESSVPFELPRGDALPLTIDADIQLILDEELVKGRAEANSAATLGVMIDADTGEILALGQAPGFNINGNVAVSKQALKNLVAETVVEPGSIFKPLVTASALDLHAVTPDEMINCENGRYSFGGHLIKDVHPSGVISVEDVLIRSSNIGMTKIGARLGKERLYEQLQQYGIGRSTGLKLPGESAGILRDVSRWSQVDIATHSFGQGVAVTPLQMVRSIAALVNGGMLPTLSLLRSETPPSGNRIISEKAANTVRDMMYGVVEDPHGTGGKAKIRGVRVGGKTGTAQKARKDGKGYQPGAYVASFAGFVDGSELGVPQRIAMVVMVDEPKSGAIYGGVLAAPIFRQVIIRTLQHLSTKNSLESPKIHISPNIHTVSFSAK